ncbi:MAG: methyltransferase [Lachnospiraceae bacterium]
MDTIAELWQEIETQITNLTELTAEDAIALRQNLSKLRQEIKGSVQTAQFASLIAGKEPLLLALLHAEDAKTRKNAVLVMGDMGMERFLEPIFTAYEKEPQMFIKSAYLSAIKAFDYRDYLSRLKDRQQQLLTTEITEDNKKHATEEMRILSELIVTMEGLKKHRFTGYRLPAEVILLTNRLQSEATEKQIQGAKTQLFNAGIKVQTNQIEKLLPIRTYQELLFAVPGMYSCELDAGRAAQTIVHSTLLSFLQSRHDGTFPFYFRVEVKSKQALDKKSIFVKKLTADIERLTHRQLINSPSNYEIEIRLIENKLQDQDTYNVLLKLYTIPDERFTYRQASISASIKPVNAALLVELAKSYMKEDAQVLDPFCGVGTMLIERQKVVKGNTAYGIDVLEEAITKAKLNTEAAGQIIHFVHKDFFDFTHEYLFDEIFTNMPFAMGHKTEEEIHELYIHFFDRAKTHLQKDGTIIMYTHNKELVKELAPAKGYTIIKQFEIMRRENTHLIILK